MDGKEPLWFVAGMAGLVAFALYAYLHQRGRLSGLSLFQHCLALVVLWGLALGVCLLLVGLVTSLFGQS